MQLAFIDPTNTNINAIHQRILLDAVDIANDDPGKHPQFFFRPSGIEATNTTDGVDGLTLVWDRENGLSHYPPDTQERIIHQMNLTAKQAIVQAIQNNAELFVGMLVGEARKGRNYFDSFIDDATQSASDRSL